MKGHSWGITAWARWQVTDRWRLDPGLATVRKNLHFKPGASGLAGTAQAGNDPRAHALLKSSLDVGSTQTFVMSLRHVARLPDPELPACTELTARYAWRASAARELSVRGVNLLHAGHREYPAPSGLRINRGIFAEARWRP